MHRDNEQDEFEDYCLGKSSQANHYLQPIYLYLIYIFLFTFFFIVDLKIPLGVAAGVPYITLILLTTYSEDKSHTYLASILAMILIVVGYFLSPKAGAIAWMVIVNRSLALGVIAIVHFFVINRKISEKKIIDLNYQLCKLANTDVLTNIGNRLLFNKVLKNEVRRSTRYKNPLSIITFDIDFFKKINDKYGHDTGDQVLVQLTKIINEKIRKTDYFFRIGGEEFAILLTETNLENAKNVAEGIRKLVANYDKNNQYKMKNVTISLGVTSFQNNDSQESFFKRADVAMYNSKNNGRNQVSAF